MSALKLISDFDYTPEFAGNKKQKEPMVVTIHLLSAIEEAKGVTVGSGRDHEKFARMIVKALKNPLMIEVDGKPERAMEVDDLVHLAGLSPLYDEIIGAYVRRRTVDLKN